MKIDLKLSSYSIYIPVMVNILIVEKSGNIKESNVKSFSEAELFKKAGYKTEEGFKSIHKWNVPLENKTYNIALYGKVKGKAGTENKYEFPPPVDTELFFGNLILTNQDENGQFMDLMLNDWEKIYEYLFGGFEDLEDEEDDLEDEDDFDDLPVTKTGSYLKDGFVVDEEDEEEEEEDEDEDDEEDDDEPVVKNKKIIKKNVQETPVEEIYLDCEIELEEEEYR
jgi:hypothetical protein